MCCEVWFEEHWFCNQEENKPHELNAVILSRIYIVISNKSDVKPFQSEPTYPPGDEPVDSEEERDIGNGKGNFDVRVRWKH